MKIAKVTGNLVSTIKTPSHKNCKLMVVQPIDESGQESGDSIIAVDGTQAGIGDYVFIIEEGGSARQILKNQDGAIDTVIAGIIDNWEIDNHWR